MSTTDHSAAGRPAADHSATGRPGAGRSAADRSAAVRAYRPALRQGVLISPPLLRGPRTVHLIKHPVSGAAFEVGPKEHFVISRLDGTRNFDDLVSEYAARFRRRLPEEQWTRLLGLLGTRGLLAGSPDPAPPEPPPARTGTFWKGSRRTVADAHATTGRLHRLLRPLLRPWVQLPLVAAVLVMTVAVLADPAAFLDGTWALLTRPAVLIPFAVFLWFSICLHELAHGIAARHYGGVVSEIGLRWRFPAVMMYCTVDNYLFLPGLRAKLVVAAAGAYVNLLLLLPFALWWALLDPADPGRPPLTGMLFVGIVQALSNLVPLPPLDGYRMLGHALGTANLAPETRTYLALRRRGRDAVAAYPRRARRLYTSYAVASVALVLLAAAGVCTVVVLLLLQ
ncbi:M50 family metallopeptidase [Streptomyces sp. LB8]|jgi:putative peptide zinc metalloprotease protein|uniref:metalloprotease n=1 Tax=Streptomyces sp. LB8 TaxID=3042509 RepID=UPI002647938B|nr:M50 family metallopeptidase [Streptomyces sp. LB8]MDN5381915.1 M50 family metallopeptidase [Streptomyces sp. LB8]